MQLTSLYAFGPQIPSGPQGSLHSHSLIPLTHIALAGEPAEILVAGSPYPLGQRRVQATVRRHYAWRGLYSSPPSWRAARNIDLFWRILMSIECKNERMKEGIVLISGISALFAGLICRRNFICRVFSRTSNWSLS